MVLPIPGGRSPSGPPEAQAVRRLIFATPDDV